MNLETQFLSSTSHISCSQETSVAGGCYMVYLTHSTAVSMILLHSTNQEAYPIWKICEGLAVH